MSIRNAQGLCCKSISFGARATIGVLLAVLFAGVLGLFLICPTANAGNPAVWSLVWSDEFDGSNGSPVDSSKWSFDIGGNGWGNNELETYTSRTTNADLEGGNLVIKTLKETFTGSDGITRNYTSARLLTRNKFTQAYGRFEARLKVPYGQGLWPAFWMLGDNIDTAHWPNCGDTFAVEWEPNVMRFYVDGLLYKTRTPADLPAGTAWVFDHPFFILLNVAVGGGFPGNPDASTVFPQRMVVDYVRVYQRATPSNVPVLFTDEGTNRALALDSVTFNRDPFSVRDSYNFSSDQTTRVMLLSANLDLQPGDGPSLVAAQADDGKGHTYPLIVEWTGRLPSFDWITVVIAKLPDELLGASQALISVTANNQSSNQVSVSISP